MKKDKKNILDEKIEKQLEKDETIDKKLLTDFSPSELIGSLMSSDEEATEKDKIIEILFEHKDIRKISDVTERNMINIAVLLTFSEEVKVPLVTYFCNTLLALALSLDRQSRKEVVEIYKTQMMEQRLLLDTMGDKPSRFARMKDKLSM